MRPQKQQKCCIVLMVKHYRKRLWVLGLSISIEIIKMFCKQLMIGHVTINGTMQMDMSSSTISVRLMNSIVLVP